MQFQILGMQIEIAARRVGGSTLNNPSKFDCLAKLRRNPDMPYFLLLASDASAPKVVQYWAALNVQVAGLSERAREKAGEAYVVAGRMKEWQAKHGSKVPD